MLFICPRHIEQFGGGEPESLWLSSPSISLSEMAMSVINCFWMKSRIRVFVLIGGVGQLFKCSGVGGPWIIGTELHHRNYFISVNYFVKDAQHDSKDDRMEGPIVRCIIVSWLRLKTYSLKSYLQTPYLRTLFCMCKYFTKKFEPYKAY